MNIKEFPPAAITATIRPEQIQNGFNLWWHPLTGEVNFCRIDGYELVGHYIATSAMGVDKVLKAVSEDLRHLRFLM